MGDIKLKNILAVEGLKLVSGERGHITATEWLYLYNKVEDQLTGAQVGIFAKRAEYIRQNYPINMDTVAA